MMEIVNNIKDFVSYYNAFSQRDRKNNPIKEGA